MAASHEHSFGHNAQLPNFNMAQSQHQQLFTGSMSRPIDSQPALPVSNPIYWSANIQPQNSFPGYNAQTQHIPTTTPLRVSHPLPCPSPARLHHTSQSNTQPPPGSHHLQPPRSLDDFIWAFIWQVIHSKIDSINRNPGPSEPTTDVQIAMAIKQDLHLYSPWESIILKRAIQGLLMPVEEGQDEQSSEVTSLSAEGIAHDSEATRDTSPDPILEHMHRVNMRKRKQQPDHEAEDRCRHRPRRRKGGLSSPASEKSDIPTYFMNERARREGMEYFMFFGDLKDPAKLQEVLCSQEKPVLYPAKASNFKIEIRNGIHQLIHTPNKKDEVDLMLCEVTGWEAKTRLGDYTQGKEMGELCVIDTSYALRLLRGEKD